MNLVSKDNWKKQIRHVDCMYGFDVRSEFDLLSFVGGPPA